MITETQTPSQVQGGSSSTHREACRVVLDSNYVARANVQADLDALCAQYRTAAQEGDGSGMAVMRREIQERADFLTGDNIAVALCLCALRQAELLEVYTAQDAARARVERATQAVQALSDTATPEERQRVEFEHATAESLARGLGHREQEARAACEEAHQRYAGLVDQATSWLPVPVPAPVDALVTH